MRQVIHLIVNKLLLEKEGKKELPIFFLEKRNKKQAYLSNTLVVPPSPQNLKRKIKTLRRFAPCHILQALSEFFASLRTLHNPNVILYLLLFYS